MRLRASLLLLLVVAPALAGCFGATASPIAVVPYLPLNDAEPGRATEFAFFLRSTLAFKQNLPVSVEGLPTNWTFQPEVEEVVIAGGATSSLIVRVTPAADARYGPHHLGVKVGDTRAEVIVNVKDLGQEPLRAGIGTQLYYVLWYDNGTLASYNEPTVAGREGLQEIPPEALGGSANDTPVYEPLKVYVGGKRGSPPPEPYNGTGYRPVIAGFDARLRDAGNGSGMVAGETLTVRIPAEEAYTLPGNEEHPLYGESLNFLIRIVSVDELAMRSCGLPVCPPSAQG